MLLKPFRSSRSWICVVSRAGALQQGNGQQQSITACQFSHDADVTSTGIRVQTGAKAFAHVEEVQPWG